MLKMKINNKSYEKCFEVVNINGSINNSARKLEVTMITKDVIDIGNKVEVYSDNENIFIGTIFKISKDRYKERVILKAFDNAISLNRSKFLKNFYQKTPSQICKEILGELNLKYGEMPSDHTKATFYAFDRSGYEIISRAYELQQKQTNKRYIILSENEEIRIIENGEEIEGLTLDSATNISNVSYEKSIENIINKIIYYEDAEVGKQIVDTQSNVESIKKYGVFQELVEKQDQVDNFFDSDKFLKAIEETASLKVIGDTRMKSGYIVNIKVDGKSEVTGKFLIESDTHIWQGSNYTTQLTLIFDSIKEG